MKNQLLFFIENYFYKGKVTSRRIEEIITSYGFTLLEYDLKVKDDVTNIIRFYNLTSLAEVRTSFTYAEDEQHKYVFIRSGCTEKDRIHLLLHEVGHIYYEHLTYKELVHDTSPTKERQANRFSFMILFLNRFCNTVYRVFTMGLIITACFIIILNSNPEPKNNANSASYFQDKVDAEYSNQTETSIQNQVKNDNDIDNQYSNNEEEDIVFYTKTGKVYHSFIDCYHIRNSDIIIGTVETCGKERLCRDCQQREQEN